MLPAVLIEMLDIDARRGDALRTDIHREHLEERFILLLGRKPRRRFLGRHAAPGRVIGRERLHVAFCREHAYPLPASTAASLVEPSANFRSARTVLLRCDIAWEDRAQAQCSPPTFTTSAHASAIPGV